MARIDYNSPAVVDEARDKLARMWLAADTKEKNRIARRLGYAGTDDSNRRVVRRLLVTKIKKSETADVTRYFRPLVTSPDEDAWTGELPPWSLEGLFNISAFVLYALETADGMPDVFSNFLRLKERDEPMTKKSNSVRELFEVVNEAAKRELRSYDPQMIGIAFSQEGAQTLLDLVNEEYGTSERIPVDPEPFRVTIRSDTPRIGRKRDKSGKLRKTLLPYNPQGATARDFPKDTQRRREMIQYINRSYGQKRRSGNL